MTNASLCGGELFTSADIDHVYWSENFHVHEIWSRTTKFQRGFFFWNNSEIPHNSKSKIWEKLDKSSKDDMARILTSVNSYS